MIGAVEVGKPDPDCAGTIQVELFSHPNPSPSESLELVVQCGCALAVEAKSKMLHSKNLFNRGSIKVVLSFEYICSRSGHREFLIPLQRNEHRH